MVADHVNPLQTTTLTPAVLQIAVSRFSWQNGLLRRNKAALAYLRPGGTSVQLHALREL